VTLPAQGARLLREYIERSDLRFWLFPGRRNEPLGTRQARRIVTVYLRQIGRGDLHTHSLRHTFGSMVVRETRSIYTAQKLLGHSDPRVTSQYYAAFDVSDADAAADAVAAALARRQGRREDYSATMVLPKR
jgi:integrase/recombinase XerC